MNANRDSKKKLLNIKLSPKTKGLIFYSPNDPSLNNVTRNFRGSYIKTSNFFKKEISKIKLALIYDREEMDNLIGHKTSSWFVGYADSSNKIFMLSPAVFDKESCHKKRDFRKALCHEISHLFVRQIHMSYEPVWLEEGLAYYVAGQKSILKNNNPLFNNSNSIFLIDTKARWSKTINSQPDIPYALAFMFVNFLIKHFGKEQVIKLLMSLKGKYSRKTFCQKFRKLYGRDIEAVLQHFFLNRLGKGGEKYVFGTRTNST